jgi:hypothetical protein
MMAERNFRQLIESIENEQTAVRRELQQHILDERPLLEVILALGTADAVRSRVLFVNLLIERELERTKLRKAIIEKTTVGAVIALLVFVGVSAWNEVVAIIRSARGH